MYTLFLVTFLNIFPQQDSSSVSPDGKFKLVMVIKDEADLQTRYITKLTDNVSNETIEIANCVRRDLPKPNFYWDKDSNYLIFEQCNESFSDSRIKILNLNTKKVELVLVGLIGNYDDTGEQFDFENGILIYFDTSTDSNGKIPDLWTFNVTTKERRKLVEFEAHFDIDLPEVKRSGQRREITIKYFDISEGQKIQKVEYY